MKDRNETLRLKNQLCFPLYLCAKEIVNKYASPLSELDLTYTQYIIMMYMWEKESSNQKEIAQTLLLDPSTLTPLLRKLEAKGFIVRARSAIDERNVIFSLTDSGRELEKRALGVPKIMKNCLDLTEEEGRQLYTLLYKVLMNLERNEE